MTLGVLYGLGGCCIFAPCVVIIDGYFIERRTLANGILCVSPQRPKSSTKPNTFPSFSASSAAPAVLSPLFSHTLTRFSPKTTLLGWAVFCGFLCAISLPFVQPNRRRLQDPTTTSQDYDVGVSEKQPLTYRFWTQPIFYILSLTTIAQGLTHFLPALYLPSFATDLGASQRDAALLITYFNIMCIITQPLYGTLM
jgi:cyanate permease